MNYERIEKLLGSAGWIAIAVGVAFGALMAASLAGNVPGGVITGLLMLLAMAGSGIAVGLLFFALGGILHYLRRIAEK